jgi:DNA-binding transcriptional ArsR family regulator
MPEPTTNADRDELFHQQALVLKALANASRLKLVHRLVRGPCPVGELTQLIASDRTTVSKHLAVLRAHGIVRDRREAGAVVYELRTPCAASVFACTRKMLEERAFAPRAARGGPRRQARSETSAA